MHRYVAAALCVAGISCGTTATAQDKVDLQELEQKVQSVLSKVRSCTVGVGGGGSGVVVSKEGHILTCAHVALRSGRTIDITFPDGRRVKATTLGNHRNADAGLVKINNPGDYPFAEMAKSEDVKEGEWVLAVGYPVSFSKRKPPPVRLGRVLRNSRNTLVSDAPIMGGDSGGPLFNLSGKVIGISSRVSQNIAANVHVPIDQFHDNWDRLLASEDWPSQSRENNRGGRGGTPPQRPPGSNPRPRPQRQQEPRKTAGSFKPLGVELQQTADGVKVKSIVIDSLAHRGGLRAGHIIKKIGDTKPKDIAACEAALKEAGGKLIPMTVTRQDANHSTVVLKLRVKE